MANGMSQLPGMNHRCMGKWGAGLGFRNAKEALVCRSGSGDLGDAHVVVGTLGLHSFHSFQPTATRRRLFNTKDMKSMKGIRS